MDSALQDSLLKDFKFREFDPHAAQPGKVEVSYTDEDMRLSLQEGNDLRDSLLQKEPKTFERILSGYLDLRKRLEESISEKPMKRPRPFEQVFFNSRKRGSITKCFRYF